MDMKFQIEVYETKTQKFIDVMRRVKGPHAGKPWNFNSCHEASKMAEYWNQHDFNCQYRVRAR
jgi:hypothetical protein